MIFPGCGLHRQALAFNGIPWRGTPVPARRQRRILKAMRPLPAGNQLRR